MCRSAAALLFKGLAVNALAYCGVRLMCADVYCVERAVVFCFTVILAGLYIALDRRILSHKITLRFIFLHGSFA